MIAGSPDAILNDKETKKVYNAFREGVKKYYGFDIKEKRSYLQSPFLKSVQSFTEYYGADDGVAIVKRLFSDKYRGEYNYRVIGKSIFTNGYRWLADNLLMEAERQLQYERKWNL